MSRNQIYYQVKIHLNTCANTYGQAPCTASLGPGFECYNSFATCQDRPNYVTKDRAMTLALQSMYKQESGGFVSDAYHCLTKHPKFTPTILKRGRGVAVRGGVDIYARDFAAFQTSGNGQFDAYAKTRPDPGAGTFFARFKAMFPYYNRAKVTLVYFMRDVNGSNTVIDSLEYRLETIQGPDVAGNIVFKCRDLLTEIDRDHAQLPKADGATLAGSINSLINTIGISNYNTETWDPAGGALVINDELISYAAFDSGTGLLTGCIRGQGGTTPSSHDAGDRAIFVKLWVTVNVVDVIYELLTVYAGIPASYIPYNDDPGNPDEWDDEKETFLAGYNITQAVTEPTGVQSLLDEICQQCYINLWYEPKTQKIRLSATNTGLASQTATPVTDFSNVLGNGLKIIEKEKRMLSQSWIYYDKNSVLGDDKALNYGEVEILVDTVLESADAWNQSRTTRLFGSWLYQGDNIAIITNQRILSEHSRPQYEVTFQLDYKDAGIYTGQFINLRADAIQGADGNPKDLTWQVIKYKDIIPGASIEITAASIREPLLGVRFATIVDVAHQGVEYGNASGPARIAWGWIAALDGFINGDDPYLMS